MNKLIISTVVAALAGVASAQAVIPGEYTDPTALKKLAENTAGYKTPEELMFPYISTYYVKPTVTQGESVKIGYYVTDFEQSKLRFLDASHRFTVRCEVTLEGGETKKLEKKDVPDGDGEFDFGALPRGDYRVMLMATDSKGRESHRVWQIFRVRTAEELTIPADKVYKMTADDLKTYSIDNTGDYGRYVQVEIPKPEKKTDWKGLKTLALKTIDEYLEKNDVRNKAKRPGYTIVVPVTDGKIHFRSYERSRVVLDDGYDTNAVEQAAIKTAEGVQKFLEEKAAAGFRKVVMLPGTYRISAFRKIQPPDNFTLDLNGATFKENAFTGAHSDIFLLQHRYDTHVVNGTVEGDYFEHDYAGSSNGSEWPMGITISGDSRYCSFEKITVKNITGYGGGNGIGKKNGALHKIAFGVGGKAGYVQGGLNRKDGTVDESDKFRFTSDFADVTKAISNGWIQCSKYLGYQGRTTRSWLLTAAWYDAEKKFISAETLWQYREVPIPAGAKYIRVSVEEKDVESAKKSGLTYIAFHWPINCTIKDCVFDRCRCVGYAASAMRNFLFDGNEFVNSGESAAKCAFDAEDGWDQMQDVFFFRNYFHDNACNNSILTCAGHNFVIDNNRCNVFLWGRTESPCIRNNESAAITINCDGRLRSGYGRCYGNKITGSLSIRGNDRGQNGWYTVVEDLDRAMKENKISVSFGQTGMVVGGNYADSAINFGSIVGATLERTRTDWHQAGKWIGVVAKDIELKNVYQTNVYERCEFIGGEFRNIGHKESGKQTFINCTFKGTKFPAADNSNIEFRDCVLEDVQISGSYWTPSSQILFSKCRVKIADKPLLSLPQWNIGRIGFSSCKIEVTGAPASVFLINDRRASKSDDAGGKIVFKGCEFNENVKSVIYTGNGATGATRPIEIREKDCKFASNDTQFVDPKGMLPCWQFPGSKAGK